MRRFQLSIVRGLRYCEGITALNPRSSLPLPDGVTIRTDLNWFENLLPCKGWSKSPMLSARFNASYHTNVRYNVVYYSSERNCLFSQMWSSRDKCARLLFLSFRAPLIVHRLRKATLSLSLSATAEDYYSFDKSSIRELPCIFFYFFCVRFLSAFVVRECGLSSAREFRKKIICMFSVRVSQ